MSKKLIIINIVAWVLIALIAVSGFLFFTFGDFSYGESNGTLNSVKEQTITSEIKNIDIEWVNGQIDIIPVESSEIKVVQKAYKELKEKYKMVLHTAGDEMKISAQKSHFFMGMKPYSTLEIYLPKKQYDELKCSVVSTYINCNDLEFINIDCENVSGRINFNNIKSNYIRSETVSGKIEFKGEFKSIDAETVSGDMEITSSVILDSLNSETVSGKITLNIPENEGFNLKFDKVSGELKSDFELIGNDKNYHYKNGKSIFDVEVVSGNLYINKI